MDHIKKRGKTKVNKPLAERRRRARINDALLQLKSIVLQSISKETTVMSKLEKADILEMTVQYIYNMQSFQGSGAVPAADSQYTVGFNECTSHVVDYISNVTDNSVKDNTVSSETISRRLLEHLVTVTGSKDFLEENKQQTVSDTNKTFERDTMECDGIKSEHSNTQIIDNKSEKIELKESENVNEKDKVDSLGAMNYAKTATIPKKRKAFADCSNFAYINRTENIKKERAKKNMCTSMPCLRDVKSKVMSPNRHSSEEAPRPVPKPIKKRLAALVYKSDDATSGHDTENDNTTCTTNAFKCKFNHSDQGLTGATEKNLFPLDAIPRTNNPIFEYANQVEQTHCNNSLFIDTSHFIETGMYNTQPLKHSGLDSHGKYMIVQKENEIPHVGALQPIMDEQSQESIFRAQFAQESSDYSYHFYQHYFANGNTENVWRPW